MKSVGEREIRKIPQNNTMHRLWYPSNNGFIGVYFYFIPFETCELIRDVLWVAEKQFWWQQWDMFDDVGVLLSHISTFLRVVCAISSRTTWRQLQTQFVAVLIVYMYIMSTFLKLDSDDLNNQLKASANSFKRFTSRLLKLSFYLSMHLHVLPRIYVMPDFIWTLPVQLRGTRNKWSLQNNLVHGRIRATNTAQLSTWQQSDFYFSKGYYCNS